MIRPPGFRGVGFGDARDGNGRGDSHARRAIATALGITGDWAWLRQVHGCVVLRADQPGLQGEADALFTTRADLPLTVATADCFPVAIEGDSGVGLAHSGWRGAAAGVVPALVAAMEGAGMAPRRAAVGPGIGPCCFEVGDEVVAALPGHRATTGWGTQSVDLPAAIAAGLSSLEVWRAGACTRCGAGYHSYRRDGTEERQVAVAWLPGD